MPTQIQIRRGTAAAWTAANPTLAEGELGVELDTSKFKIGTGSTAWTSLAYATGPSGPSGAASTVPGATGPSGAASTVPGPTGPTGAASTVAGPTGPTGAASTVPGPTGATGAASTVAGPTGPSGPSGAASTVAGPTGPTGPSGAASTVPGPTGATGAGGYSVLTGVVAPTTEGVNGDFFINTATSTIYGPKAAGAWPSGVLLVGPTGPTGAASTVPGPTGPTGAASTVAGPTGPTGAASTVPGPTGPTGPSGAASTVPGATGASGAAGYAVLSGVVAPTAEGVNGDFFIDTATSTIYGPKAAGSWPSGVLLVGPTGPTGAASTVPGPTGPTGAASTVAGPTGPTGAASTVPGPTGPTGPSGAASTVAGPTGPTGAAGATGASGSGASITAEMTPMTTERTTTSGTFADVTSASVTYTVVSATYLYIGYSFEMKDSSGSSPESAVQVLAGSTVLNATYVGAAAAYVTLSTPQTTYGVYNGFALVPAAVVGTGSQTFKFRFRTAPVLYGITTTAYVKNCYLTIQSI